MKTVGKRFKGVATKVDKNEIYSPDDAVRLAKETASAKFDETVDLAIQLGVDPKKGDQVVRGVTNLPHGTGKKQRVLVFAKGPAADAAQAAGAEMVGAEELVEQIQKGWKDWKNFDVIVAEQALMPVISKIGGVLKAAMPTPKSGTVTTDPGKVVEDIKKASRVDYRVEKAGIVHMPIGKASFSEAQLKENLAAALSALIKAKPQGAKGRYLQRITISTTMGPGIRIDTVAAQRLGEVGA